MAAENHVVAGKERALNLDSRLKKSVEEIVKREGYTSYAIVKRKFATGGGSFLGELLEIDIIGKTVDGDKETNLFIKKRHDFEKITIASLKECYSREVFLYIEYAKLIAFLEDRANLPKEDRYKVVKAYNETDNHVLIFENLAKRGFKTYDRLHIPPLKYIQLACVEIAKFHAISFVIEYNMPDFFQNKVKSLDNPYNTFDDDFKTFIEKTFAATANLFDDEETKIKLERFLPTALAKLPRYERDQTSVRCCLIHGDYRMNNILLREINGEPLEVIPVDYQLLHYGCPLKDFLFFVFSCTQRDFRAKHLNDLKELYFETLSRNLKYFDLNVEEVYPRKEFEEAYKEWLDYGLIRSLFASLFLFAPETGIDLVTMSLSELPFNPEKPFEQSARGWIEDFIEWGYL